MEKDKYSVRKKKGINTMYKELAISIIIIILIFGLNYITQKTTDNVVETMTTKLDIVRQEVAQDNPNKEQAMNGVKIAYDKWEELDDKLAYYIEHDELEKVKTALTSAKSYIEVAEYSRGCRSNR